MADFNKAFDITMGHEGGLANNPKDKGGLTYKGITSRDWPNWPGWVQVNNARRQSGDTKVINRILAMDQDLQLNVRKFYKLQYWDVHRLDQFESQTIANELFDTGINQGVVTVAKYLQRALNAANRVQQLYPNIKVDGVVGQITVSMVNKNPNPKLILLMLNVLQGYRYIQIMENDEDQEIFAISWFGRVSLAT